MSGQAPERIYLQYSNGEDLPVTWADKSIYDSDVEYIRADKYSELEEENRIMKEALEMFSNLKTAYPESVFKPMSNVQYKLLCDNACVSVDRVSAHVLRTVTKGYAELADTALQQIKETDR